MARRTFFSFHYNPDIHRAWNVRNSWVTQDRKSAGFFDSSVFEESKKSGDVALKRFLNKGLQNTSVTCILAGTDTWRRRWVRYEIQKSFLEGKGILTVHIHTISNLAGKVASKGNNPLDYIAFHIDENDRLALKVKFNGKWSYSKDFSDRVLVSSLPYKFRGKRHHTLATLFKKYDWKTSNGRQNLGDWIEAAATAAGR